MGTPFLPEMTEKPPDGLTHFQSMMMVLMTTGLLSKLLKRMFPFSNLNLRKTSTERERSTILMVMVLKTTLRDQEMNSMISTTQINLEMPEMISITPITETSQDISDLRNTNTPQPKLSCTNSLQTNSSIPTTSLVDLIQLSLKPRKKLKSNERNKNYI